MNLPVNYRSVRATVFRVSKTYTGAGFLVTQMPLIYLTFFLNFTCTGVKV